MEIDSLKRNVKLAKNREFESELSVYVEECQRLRTILEQTAIQNETLQDKLESQGEGSPRDLISTEQKERQQV